MVTDSKNTSRSRAPEHEDSLSRTAKICSEVLRSSSGSRLIRVTGCIDDAMQPWRLLECLFVVFVFHLHPQLLKHPIIELKLFPRNISPALFFVWQKM